MTQSERNIRHARRVLLGFAMILAAILYVDPVTPVVAPEGASRDEFSISRIPAAET